MRILQLSLNNWMSYKEASIKFPPGVTLIYGEDLDRKISVGVGKSAIKEALLFSLFGKCKFSNLDSAIRFGEKYFDVSVLFEIQGETYKIERHKKLGSTPSIRFLNVSKNTDITCSNNTLTQRSIEKLLGFDYETFCLVYTFGQSEYDDISKLKSGKLLELFLSLFDLSLFEEIEEEISELCRSLELQIAKLEGERTVYDEFESKKFRSVETLSKRVAKLDSIISSLNVRIQNKKRQVQELETQFSSFSSQLYKLNNARTSCEKLLKFVCPVFPEVSCPVVREKYNLEELQSRSSQLSFQISQLQEQLRKIERFRNLELENIEELHRKISKASSLKQKISSELQILADKRSNLREISQQLSSLRNRLAVVSQAKKVFKKEGFSHYLLEQQIPHLQFLINKYLSQLTDFSVKISTKVKYKTVNKFRNTIEFSVIRNGEEYSLENLSNGQSFLISLCIRLGLNELVIHKRPNDLRMLIIDDEFGRADEKTNSLVVSLLNSLSEYDHIFLMAHSPVVREKIRCAQRLFVKMKDGVSAVEYE